MQKQTLLVIALVFNSLVIGSGCQSSSGVSLVDSIGSKEAAIVNGQKYSGHPSVGMLVLSSGKVPSGICTATLVGKKTVLTAAHCIDENSDHTFVAGNKQYPAASVHIHPYWDKDYVINDIAVVLLKTQPPIVPTAIATVRPQQGAEITLVGYGVTSDDANDEGVKRIAKNVIKKISSTTFSYYGASGNVGNTCYGDSGGPAFALQNGLEVQVGVTSTGASPCGTAANDTRVDYYASWISQTAGGDVVTDPAHPPAVDTVDNDKTAPVITIVSPQDGATVGELVQVKTTITDNVGVIKARLDVDGSGYNSKTAEPFEFQASLSPGKHTLKVLAWDEAGNQGTSAEITVNVPNNGATTTDPGQGPGSSGGDTAVTPPAPGTYGATCTKNEDCQSGLCASQPEVAGQFCTQKCDPNAATPCPQDATCDEAAPGLFVCSAPATVIDQNAATAGENNSASGGCSMSSDNTAATPGHLLGALFVVAMLGLLQNWRRKKLLKKIS